MESQFSPGKFAAKRVFQMDVMLPGLADSAACFFGKRLNFFESAVIETDEAGCFGPGHDLQVSPRQGRMAWKDGSFRGKLHSHPCKAQIGR